MIDIVAKLDEETARRIKQSAHYSNRASEAGHPCIRFLVLSRLYPELKTLHDVGLQRIFDEGNIQEEAMIRELQGAGFKIIEQQRDFNWKELQLTGRIDAKLSLNGSDFPLEIKSCSPNVFPVVKQTTPEDMIKSKYFWVRRYPGQLLMYMLMSGEDTGIILFKNKTTGEKCQKIFELHDENLEYAESILKKLEEVNGFVSRKELPTVEMIEECKGCGFAKTSCFPGQDYGPGFDFIADDKLEAKLVRWEETKETAKEHEELDKELKEHFKGKTAVVGDFMIESKEYEHTNYKVPKEIKEQYAEKSTYFRTTIERL
jgi:predicted Zn-ribbon and HTH transcriptional regulator